MIYSTSSERRDAAFNILADVVQRWYAEGRRAYGASLKPEMRALTSNEFDEKQLGYMTFRQFLLAAASSGLVDVVPAPNSPDVQVVPKGKAPMEHPVRRVRPQASVPRIREDLWKAFVDWNTAFERFYDRVDDKAHRIAATGSAYDSSSLKSLRAQKQAEPARFVAISPITFDEQVDWMRQFAGKQPADAQLRLLRSVDSGRPARDFSMAVRQFPDIATAWQAERFQRVLERIEAWKIENKLAVDIYAPPPEFSDRARGRRGHTTIALDEHRLRERIHAAVEAMSVAELLDLPIRLQHFVDIDR